MRNLNWVCLCSGLMAGALPGIALWTYTMQYTLQIAGKKMQTNCNNFPLGVSRSSREFVPGASPAAQTPPTPPSWCPTPGGKSTFPRPRALRWPWAVPTTTHSCPSSPGVSSGTPGTASPRTRPCSTSGLYRCGVGNARHREWFAVFRYWGSHLGLPIFGAVDV